jgi:uncharacterized membrane protein
MTISFLSLGISEKLKFGENAKGNAKSENNNTKNEQRTTDNYNLSRIADEFYV